MANFFSNWFNKVPVDVQKYSGYDEPHEHFFTAKVGEIVPADIIEILPGDIVDLGVSAQIQLPPMATDFYGRVDAKFFTFFVPNRLVYGGFEDTLGYSPDDPSNPDSVEGRPLIPGIKATSFISVAAGTLADYLGFKRDEPSASQSDALQVNNCMPFLAYHLIWAEWFRDSRLQINPFGKRNYTAVPSSNRPAYLPTMTVTASDRISEDTGNRCQFLDGSSIFNTRQINWSKDYFTNCTTLPQSGQPARIILPLEVFGNVPEGGTQIRSEGTTQLSMTSLFGANALQRWKQIKNISGTRYGEYQYAIFGVYPESYICDRPVYLGQHTIPVYNRSIFQNAPASVAVGGQNPFESVGSKYASPLGVGNGQLCAKRKFTEHGYLMTLFCLVPSATYSTGVDRMFQRYRAGDFADPIFAGVGDQAVMRSEITSSPSAYGGGDIVFGYTQRFAEYKFKLDKVSGLLRDGELLSSFALQRSFTSAPLLGTQFLQVPQDYLDQVAAVNGSVSTYGCWVDAGFRCKILHRLPAYSIGTLADPKFTETKMVDNGGKRLS